jgi:hypothetical protein
VAFNLNFSAHIFYRFIACGQWYAGSFLFSRKEWFEYFI